MAAGEAVSQSFYLGPTGYSTAAGRAVPLWAGQRVAARGIVGAYRQIFALPAAKESRGARRLRAARLRPNRTEGASSDKTCGPKVPQLRANPRGGFVVQLQDLPDTLHGGT